MNAVRRRRSCPRAGEWNRGRSAAQKTLATRTEVSQASYLLRTRTSTRNASQASSRTRDACLVRDAQRLDVSTAAAELKREDGTKLRSVTALRNESSARAMPRGAPRRRA